MNSKRLLHLLAPCLLLLPGKQLPWSADYEEAMRKAAGGNGMVMVAIHMDGIPTCTELLELYEERELLDLASGGAVLVASGDEHARGRCPLFDGLECDDHIEVDLDVRKELLGSVAGRQLVAPQHLFADATGRVVLSVPFGVTKEELEWCFHAALSRIDASHDANPRWEVKAPRALVWNGVVDPGSAPPSTPVSEDEVEKAIDELKRGGQTAAARLKLMERLALADHEDAREFLQGVMRSGVGGGRGSGMKARDLRPQLVRHVGESSPPSYWEVVSERIDGGEETLQLASIIALEQLAHPDSLRSLLAALRSEKEPAMRHALARAVGAVGAADGGARKALLRLVDDRDEVLRRNVLLALGFLAQHEEVEAALREALLGEDAGDQAAAALGIGCTRERRWLELLKEVQPDAVDATSRAAIESAIEVIEGARLSALAQHVVTVCGDEYRRTRIFGGGGRGGRGGEERRRR